MKMKIVWLYKVDKKVVDYTKF